MRNPFQLCDRVQVAGLAVEFTFIATSIYSLVFFVRLTDVEVVVDLLSQHVIFLVVYWVNVDTDMHALVTPWVGIQEVLTL